ncbi:MAG: 5-carboxymethyl-2-hydroxymuconate isomerase, partial [Rhizobiales bacterium 35-66-30]
LNQMIWKVPEMIATLSTLFRLEPGDLIFAGTPAGVGPTVSGDVLEGGVAGVASISLTIA